MKITSMKIIVVSVLTVLLMGVPMVIDTAVVEAARTLQEVWSVAEAFERAWNNHDADGMASLFTGGANMVTLEHFQEHHNSHRLLTCSLRRVCH